MAQFNEEQRNTFLKAWKAARVTGQSQEDFCKGNGLSSRTLRTWIAAEGTPKTTVRQAEIVLRRMARHLLEAAEHLGAADDVGIGLEGASAHEAAIPMADASQEAVPLATASPIDQSPHIDPPLAQVQERPRTTTAIQWNFD